MVLRGMLSLSMSSATEAKSQILQGLWRAWPKMNSPCLREQVSISFQLGFLGILLLVSLGKLVRFLGKRGNATGQAMDRHTIGNRSSIIYKSSVVCTALILGTHLLMLLMLMNGNDATCRSKTQAFSSEIMQLVSWTVTLAILYKIHTEKYMKFPWILRTWWMCNFLLSAFCTTLDVNYIITHHGHLRTRDFANFMCLLASTGLFSISIWGKTGMDFLYANGIREPLLSENVEKHSESKQESPYGKATLFEVVTFSWLNPLLSVGIKKPLEQNDVPDLDIKDFAAFVSCSFSDCLKQVKDKDTAKNPSIYKAIFFFIRKKVLINALFAVVSAGASYVGPYLVDDFVNFLTDKKSRSLESGYVLALAFLGAKLVETIAQRQYIFGARQLGLRLRAALISHVYKKGLVLSSQSRQSHTSGEIINYMSVDVQRITDLIWYLNNIWMLPIQISLAIYILHTNLGLGSVAALAATLTVMACNIPLNRTQRKYQSKIMEAKDSRMKSNSEVLQNMNTIKLQAWDNQFLNKLESLRKIEYEWLWKSQRLEALSGSISWGTPAFISVVTFGTCVLMGIQLTAGRVLAALATFRLLQDPIFRLPDLLNVIAQGKVSADRVSSYLQEDEIQHDAIEYIPKNQAQFDIEIINATFSWNLDLNTPTLNNIELKVKRGMKVAICGMVGSGKSSLLSCILGEIEKLSGQVKISGTKAYVPQSPWILSGNIRDNILFGNPYDPDKYYQTVQSCALIKDFELFSAGDLTEIGERGINMSGGQKQRIQIARAVYQDADIYLLDDPFSAVDAHTGTRLFADCLMGILKDKTVLYVTHQVEFLPAADLILVMRDGRIAQAGIFDDLMKQNIGFEVLVGAHSEALVSILTVENSSRTTQDPTADGESNKDLKCIAENPPKHDSEHDLSLEISEKEGRLVQDEERERGSIGKEVYWSYLTTVKGGALIPIIVLAQCLFQILQVVSNYWMAWACPPASDKEPVYKMDIILLIYILLVVGSSLCILLRTMLVAVAGLWTAQNLFTKMLHSVMRAPMAFFDSTPTGRILNRASTDQSVLDLDMAWKLGWCAFSITQMLGTIAVMSQVAWEVFVIFIPVTAICIWYQVPPFLTIVTQFCQG
ncbi:hypothetical protein BT93_I1633 [Corymbia citriodora subsp. variegata]|nr:hypothetical protein BT93_I1633 [Corymbia citriodora subsp. variegata]